MERMSESVVEMLYLRLELLTIPFVIVKGSLHLIVLL